MALSVFSFPPMGWMGVGVGRLEPFAFTMIDVVALTVFQLLSTNGIYPLLIMVMLPILLGFDVSSRRVAVVLVSPWSGSRSPGFKTMC